MRSEWTQAVRGAQFLWLPIPAYSSLSVLVWILYAKVWTFCLALVVIGLLTYLNQKGRSVPWVIRRAKTYLRGGIVQARPVWYRRRTQHLGSFDLVDLKGK